MRIISRFQDYYDSALAHGADMSQIYRREQRVVDAIMLPFTTPYNGASDYFQGGILIVCGKPVIRVRHSYVRDGRPVTSEWRDHYDPSDALCEKRKWRSWRDYPSQARLEESFSGSTWDQLCVRHTTPLLLLTPWVDKRSDGVQIEDVARVRADSLHSQRRGYGESIWSVMRDPRLADFEFQKVVHPFQMLQEISMYMGSQLAKETDKMFMLTDTERLEKHGFDKKTSFRNTKD
jgi:hypothetical protein